MKILQPSWRGRDIQTRKDVAGKYTAMIGIKALLYVPVGVLPKAVYKIIAELCNESGNGIIYCNIYGNKNHDFKASRIKCEEKKWTTFDVDVVTGEFPKTLPMMFRVWRGKDGTGTILIRKFIVELIEGEVKAETEGKIILNNLAVPAPPPAPPPAPSKKPKPRPRIGKGNGPEPAPRPKESKYPTPPANLVISKDHKVNEGGVKVLYLPLNSMAIFQTGMEDAFIENGFNLRTFDYRNSFAKIGSAETCRNLKTMCEKFQPDWIHMQLQFTGLVPGTIIKEIKQKLPDTIITNWSGDIRDWAKKYFLDIDKQIDLSLISSEGQLPLYKSSGCKNIEYWQIGIDPKKFRPLSATEKEALTRQYEGIVSFCANHSGRFPDSDVRKVAVNSLIEAFGQKFSVYGTGWGRTTSSKGSITYYEQNAVYNSSLIAININNFNNVAMYFSDRQLITMASGALVLCHYIPELERYFENKRDVVWFHSPQECVELVKYYLEHPDEAREIGKNGAKKIVEQHTYAARVKELAMRLGIFKSAKESLKPGRQLPEKNEDPVKVLGVVVSSKFDAFCHRITAKGIEFQGARYNQNVKRIAAEFCPDLIHFHIKSNKYWAIVKEIRKMIEPTVFSCYVDEADKEFLRAAGNNMFDYVLSGSFPKNAPANGLKLITVDDKVDDDKTRADMIKEALLVTGGKK